MQKCTGCGFTFDVSQLENDLAVYELQQTYGEDADPDDYDFVCNECYEQNSDS